MREWNIVKAVTLISVILFTVIFIKYGITEDANRINLRLSARIAAILFSMAFMASSMQYFFKGVFTFWMLANRKFLGISFAIVHTMHLSLLVLLHFCFHPIFAIARLSSLLSGGLAYLFIFLMFLTSFDRFSNYLSKKSWKVLHTSGGYWIWLIFMISYAKRVDTEIEYLPLILLFAGTLLLRFTMLIRRGL